MASLMQQMGWKNKHTAANQHKMHTANKKRKEEGT
jgi:hypothetical protein